MCHGVVELRVKQFGKSGEELVSEAFIGEKPSKQQGCAGACGPGLVAEIGGVFEHIEVWRFETGIAVVKDPAPLSSVPLPASHVVCRPIGVAEEHLEDLVVDETVEVEEIRHSIVFKGIGEVGMFEAVHHLDKLLALTMFN